MIKEPVKDRGRIRGVTVADIARLAKVSTATVSRVLSGNVRNDYISSETEQKVRKAAKELNYMPSRLPMLLKSGLTGLLNISFPSVGFWHEDWLYHAFEDQDILSFIGGASMIFLTALEEKMADWNLVVSFRKTGTNIYNPIDYKMDFVDGIFYTQPYIKENDSFYHICKSGFPIVFDTLMKEKPDYYCVGGDDAYTATLAVSYLHHIGRRRIRFFNAGPADSSITRARIKGYTSGVKKFGLKPFKPVIYDNSDYISHRFEYIEKILGDGRKLDALITGDTLSATHFTRDAMQMGIRIPDDVAIICLGDRMECQINVPPLTVLCQPTALVYSEGIDMLLKIIKGEPIGIRQKVIPPQFTIRGSCGGTLEAARRVIEKL